MRPFIHGRWHIWQGTAQILVSDEDTKILREYDNTDAVINWLFLNGHREAARALNTHVKAA